MKFILCLLFLTNFCASASDLKSGIYYKRDTHYHFLYNPEQRTFKCLLPANEVILKQMSKVETGDFLTVHTGLSTTGCEQVQSIENVGLKRFLGLWSKTGFTLDVRSYDTAVFKSKTLSRIFPRGKEKIFKYSVIPSVEPNEWVMFFSDSSDSYFVTARVATTSSQLSFYDNENGELIESLFLTKPKSATRNKK